MRTLLLLAAALFAGAVSAADAAPRSTSLPTVDVAAIPAYPLSSGTEAPRAGRRAAGLSMKRHREARRSRVGREASLRASPGESGPGIVRSRKTGATARVGESHAARFQAYVDDVEAHGGAVKFMGGIRRGRCSEASKHPCGRALDVCQLSRGVVDARCHLPSPVELERIAARHGLVEGGRWCHTDYGHVETSPGAQTCPGRPYAVGRAIVPAAHRLARHRHRVKMAASR